MSNVTVQEALKNALFTIRCYRTEITLDKKRPNDLIEVDLVISEIEAALADIEKCEPVAYAIRERDRLGFAVVKVMTKLDEIIENTQEAEIDDFLHIAVPIDMWNELQAALEDMPKRADIYTSPQPRDWVEINKEEMLEIYNGVGENSTFSFADLCNAISAKLKQLNTKG